MTLKFEKNVPTEPGLYMVCLDPTPVEGEARHELERRLLFNRRWRFPSIRLVQIVVNPGDGRLEAHHSSDFDLGSWRKHTWAGPLILDGALLIPDKDMA